MKSLGMNTKAIYYPNVRMYRALADSREAGLTRIEITYQAFTPEAEKSIWGPFFLQTAYNDLAKVQAALGKVPGLCWSVHMKDLIDQFQESARSQQLLILQPTIVAMVYAANSKPGCYTGHW